MKKNLGNIEKKLQTIFEDHFQRLSKADILIIASRELLARQNTQTVLHNNRVYSPNIFRITFRDEASVDKNNIESWKDSIADLLRDSARENHFFFSGPIHIQLYYNADLSDEINIVTEFSSLSTSKTVDIIVNNENQQPSCGNPSGYLITPYETDFKLTKKVISIGRDETNDLVIDNLRVSRIHAQIREIESSHVLFDLDSTVGTKVNKRRISQHTLSTGDVIEIADVALIYNSDFEKYDDSSPKSFTKILPVEERRK